jgi:ubiquinone/menaquinone biosynthesis C-methylase UbiE
MKERDRIVTAFSEMSQRYETKMNNELSRFWGWSYEEFVNILLNNVQIKPTDPILDVATGTSFIPIRLIKTHPNIKQIVGLDITLGMLLKGRQNAPSLFDEGRIKLVCGTALVMPLTGSSFELVICRCGRSAIMEKPNCKGFYSDSGFYLFFLHRKQIPSLG